MQRLFTCSCCGKVEPALKLQGPLLQGVCVQPKGWESEQYSYLATKGGTWSFGKAWFCSRRCRGRWVMETADQGYRMP